MIILEYVQFTKCLIVGASYSTFLFIYYLFKYSSKMNVFPEMKFSWRRPTEIPYPNVWHRFQTKPTKNGSTFKVKVQDLPLDRIDEAVEFMTKYFIADEALRRAVNFTDDEISVKCQQYMMATVMAEKMTLVAMLDEDNDQQIIGVQMYTVTSKQDPPLPKFAGKAREKMDKVYDTLQGNFKPIEYFQTDAYLYDWGISVASEFRGLGVGFQLMDSIKLLAKAVNIRLIVIRCNCIEAQISSEKMGFKKYRELRYSDCKDENGQPVCVVEGTEAISIWALTL